MPHATLAPATLATQWRQPYWRHILESLHLAAACSAAQQREVLLRGETLALACGPCRLRIEPHRVGNA